MLTITSTSLSGGQGKTTLIYFLAKKLVSKGLKVLVVDLDPQHNLSTYLRVNVERDEPSCLEFIQGNFNSVADCIYPVETVKNLFIIPSDEGLEIANDYLASSGFGIVKLRNQLDSVKSEFKFDYCLIDTPPQKSQLCQTGIGASDYFCVPVEIKSKGVICLDRTLEAIESLNSSKIINTKLLAVLPFRDRLFGMNRSIEGKKALEQISSRIKPEQLLPAWIESVQPEKAVNRNITLEDIEFGDLSYPFDVLAEQLEQLERLEQLV